MIDSLNSVLYNPNWLGTARKCSRSIKPVNVVPIQLSSCDKAVLLVVKSALKARAQKGENLFRVAHLSKHGCDFGTLMRILPEPLLCRLQAGQYGRVYTAALECNISPFDSLCGIEDLDKFVDWISQHTEYSAAALVLACIYIDRLFANHAELFLCKSNVLLLFAISYMIAGKFLEDEQVCVLTEVSEELDMEADRVKMLETILLRAIRYDVFVSSEQLREAEIALMTEAMTSEDAKEVSEYLEENNIDGHDCAKHNIWENERKTELEQQMIRVGRSSPKVEFDGKLEGVGPWGVISELARAQLKHDLHDDNGSGARGARAMGNDGERRLRLRALAEGAVLRDRWLPKLLHAVGASDGLGNVCRWEHVRDVQLDHLATFEVADECRRSWREEQLEVRRVRLQRGCVDEVHQ